MGPTRGALAGVVCAVGAMGAHAAGGGTVPVGAALFVLAAAALLGPKVVLASGVSAAHTLALALVAQVLWHAVFMVGAELSATAAMSHGPDPTAMLLQHLAAALVTALVAWRSEQRLVDAVDWLYGVLLPRLATTGPLPQPLLPGAPEHREVHPHDPAFTDVRPPRGPPSSVLLG